MASPQCCANPPTLNPAGGEGKAVDSFGGILAYVAGAEDSKAAVILISDIFGDCILFSATEKSLYTQRKQRSGNHLEDSAVIVRVVVSAEAPPEMRFREFKEDPPEYVLYPSEESNLFTLEVVHNGFFCGLRDNLEYVVSSIDHFDYLTGDTWSMDWMNEILTSLGLARDGKLHLYWCLPDKDIREGLVPLDCDAVIRRMARASLKEKTLCVFVDHTDFLRQLRTDVVQSNAPVANSPSAVARPPPAAAPSIASSKMAAAAVSRAVQAISSGSSKFPNAGASPLPEASCSSFVEEGVSGNLRDSDSDNDFEFYGSDYDVEDGDDDLFADNVDKSVGDNNEKEMVDDKEDEDALDDETLQLGEENMVVLRNKLTEFNPTCDMHNPIFVRGMTFSGVEELRKALATYAVRNRKKIKKVLNDRRRLTAHCAAGYPWYMRAGTDLSHTCGFVIKKYEGKHTCEGSWPLEAISSKLLTEKFMHEFRDNQKLGLQSFAAKILREFKMCPNRYKLTRARKAALLQIHGDEESQFGLLHDYGQELRRSNPGSKFFLTTNSVNDPSSGEHKEHLATGLINAVQKLFPESEHRFCVRHMIQNFQRAGHRGETLKNDVWAIARSTSIPKWKRTMDKLQVDCNEAFQWIDKLDPKTWVKAFFSDFPKCEMLLNNHSEVFNSYSLEAREMAFLSMLETIFYKILQRQESKQREGMTWTGRICPKIKKRLEKFFEWSNNCIVKPAGNYLFAVEIHEFEKDYSVVFKSRTCDCKRWQLTGIPCHHAIACCRKDNINYENLVHNCYTVETYKRAYAYTLAPLRGRAFWEKMNATRVHPPLYTKVMGRPKRCRRKAPEEKVKKGVTYFTKAGTIIHCSICGKSGHNKKGHQTYLLRQQQQMEEGVIWEDEEIDIPSILETAKPDLDPTNIQESMVYRMQQEQNEHMPANTVLGPLPENEFIASARDKKHKQSEFMLTSAADSLLEHVAVGLIFAPEQYTSPVCVQTSPSAHEFPAKPTEPPGRPDGSAALLREDDIHSPQPPPSPNTTAGLGNRLELSNWTAAAGELA
ncbi:hypothetical protein ACQ4PT_019399 [Festuca glaucescens]